MKISKRFSFVIPTYQKKVLLKNTLESLNRQKGYSRKDYEAVVIDDGSTDGTEEYIKGINKNYDLTYIYLPRCADSSRARTRNKGIEAATGEIIVFIDADMLIREDYLHELDQCFKMDQNIIVIGNRIMLNEDVTYEEMLSPNPFLSKKFQLNSFKKVEMRHLIYRQVSYNALNQIYPWLQVFSCNMAVHRTNLDKVGHFDENFKGWGSEDVELGYRLYKKGTRIIINNNIESYHQYHEGATGLRIPPERYPDIETNTTYLMQKHPEAMKYGIPLVIKLFKGKFFLRLNVTGGKLIGFRIKLKDESELDNVKAKILKYSKHKGWGIKVIDYLENTDLAFWIQSRNEYKSIPHYFPVSKKIEMRKAFTVLMSISWGISFFLLRLNCIFWEFIYRVTAKK